MCVCIHVYIILCAYVFAYTKLEQYSYLMILDYFILVYSMVIGHLLKCSHRRHRLSDHNFRETVYDCI